MDGQETQRWALPTWEGSRRALAWLSRPVDAGMLRLVLAGFAVMLALAFAGRWFVLMTSIGSQAPPFTDANTYAAAGERLNAGHDLHSLVPGDRYVFMPYATTGAPLLSPPPIAVIWRALALLPLGFDLWVVGCWLALLGTAIYLIWRTGLLGWAAVLALAPALGEQLAACNLAAFFPLMLLLAWQFRSTSGLLGGLMAATKLAPGALLGWLVGVRAWRQVLVFGVVLLVALVGSIVGAGMASLGEYIRVAVAIEPNWLSLSGASGMPALSEAVLIGGTVLAALVSRRHEGLGFALAVVAMVLGTPALYTSGLVTLLGVLVPLTSGREATGALRPTAVL